MTYSVREMRLDELKLIYKHIKRDFPIGEYAPYFVLHSQLKKGTQQGLILSKDDVDVAYSICAAGQGKSFVLISLMAVFEQHRGEGVGTAFLHELGNNYTDKQGIIVEVERPADAKTEVDKELRGKRIRFYEKAGFCLVPNIIYSIWGVPMHLMVLTNETDISNERVGEIIYDIYLQIMGKRFIHKLKFEVIK